MKRTILLLAMLPLTACGAPRDTVVFVINTSFGINADSKPPTVAIAYDRQEGYLGPRTANGGMPPVVASIQTNGDVFNPKVRQVYATGAAATLVTDPAATPGPASDLTGLDGKMVFFGTATSVGLKVGFDESGAPDSVLFGYKRKELSVIPLGTDGGKLVYPSVLASIDTTAATSTLKDTGLSVSQYFATGRSAELLAANSASIRSSFATLSSNAMLSNLTPQQQQAALAQGTQIASAQKTTLEKVMGAAAPNGTLDKAALASLISKANAARPNAVNPALAEVTTAEQLQARLQYDVATTASLAQAVGP